MRQVSVQCRRRWAGHGCCCLLGKVTYTVPERGPITVSFSDSAKSMSCVSYLNGDQNNIGEAGHSDVTALFSSNFSGLFFSIVYDRDFVPSAPV